MVFDFFSRKKNIFQNLNTWIDRPWRDTSKTAVKIEIGQKFAEKYRNNVHRTPIVSSGQAISTVSVDDGSDVVIPDIPSR